MFGNLITDLTYLLVYSLFRDRRGAYWFLLVAPVFEGSLGGMPNLLGTSCPSAETHHRPKCRHCKHPRLYRGLH